MKEEYFSQQTISIVDQDTFDQLCKSFKTVNHYNFKSKCQYHCGSYYSRLCANPLCNEQSFYCANNSCKSQSYHKKCPTYQLQFVLEQINKLRQNKIAFLKNLQQIERSFIDKIKQIKYELTKQFGMSTGLMLQENMQFIETCNRNNFCDIKGVHIQKLMNYFETNLRIQQQRSKVEQNYQKQLDNVSNNFKDVVLKCYQNYQNPNNTCNQIQTLKQKQLFSNGQIEQQIQKIKSYLEEINRNGLKLQNKNQPKKAIIQFEKGIDLYQKCINNINLIYANTLKNYSKVHIDNKQTNQNNQPYLIKSIKIKKSIIGQKQEIIQLMILLASCRFNEKKYKQSNQCYQIALGIQKKNKIKQNTITSQIYHNMGLNYFRLGQKEKSLSYYEKSYRLRQVLIPNSNQFAYTLYNIGIIYHIQQKFNQAREYYQKSKKILDKNRAEIRKHLARLKQIKQKKNYGTY